MQRNAYRAVNVDEAVSWANVGVAVFEVVTAVPDEVVVSTPSVIQFVAGCHPAKPCASMFSMKWTWFAPPVDWSLTAMREPAWTWSGRKNSKSREPERVVWIGMFAMTAPPRRAAPTPRALTISGVAG